MIAVQFAGSDGNSDDSSQENDSNLLTIKLSETIGADDDKPIDQPSLVNRHTDEQSRCDAINSDEGC